jgi:double-strand break repair protein MRE11
LRQSGALSSLDLLSTAGLVNYFGKTDLPKHTKYDKDGAPIGLTVEPVLLRKGTTSLALYGMGNVKDVRMNAELRAGRVTMRKPMPQEGVEWFNIVLVHQNRCAAGAAYTLSRPR